MENKNTKSVTILWESCIIKSNVDFLGDKNEKNRDSLSYTSRAG